MRWLAALLFLLFGASAGPAAAQPFAHVQKLSCADPGNGDLDEITASILAEACAQPNAADIEARVWTCDSGSVIALVGERAALAEADEVMRQCGRNVKDTPTTTWTCDGGAQFAAQNLENMAIYIKADGDNFLLMADMAQPGVFSRNGVTFRERNGQAELIGAGVAYENCKT